MALVAIERAFEGGAEVNVDVEETCEEGCDVDVGDGPVVERAVVELPFWMAECARKAARKLARKDLLVGMVWKCMSRTVGL